MRALALAAALVAGASCGFPRPARLADGGSDVGDAPGDGVGSGPHCAGLASTCGPNSRNCCASGMVPGGTFYRGYDVGSDGAFPDMTHPATLSTFVLDNYLVTVGRFRQFVTAGMGTQADPPSPGTGAHTKIASSGWEVSWNTSLPLDTAALVADAKCDQLKQAWTDAPGGNETLPMNCVNWYDAMAFCIWDGGYLPTEAELNYAAVGGSEQRAFPWSMPASSLTIDCSYANYSPSPTSVYCTENAAMTSPILDPVGHDSPNGDGRWGQSDLAGQGFEWTLDYYSATYITPCTDCANLTVAAHRADRGGGYEDPQNHLRGGDRVSDDPLLPNPDVVFRCARAQ